MSDCTKVIVEGVCALLATHYATVITKQQFSESLQGYWQIRELERSVLHDRLREMKDDVFRMHNAHEVLLRPRSNYLNWLIKAATDRDDDRARLARYFIDEVSPVTLTPAAKDAGGIF